MFQVRILGNSSATPAFQRHTSAQAINYNDRYYLVDCGEGTQMQLQRYRIKYSRIDAIFISHLHGDHILGLPGLLASLSIFERMTALPVFAPRGMKEIVDLIFSYSDTKLNYDLQFHALEDFEPGAVIYETDRLVVSTIPLHHRAFCRGFLFRERNKRRKFDFYKAKSLEIPKEYFHLLKQENDVTLPDGRKIQAEEVLFPREHPLSYAYCSDTMTNEEMLPHIEHVSLLYHEATFMEKLKDRALATHHSTTKDAARTAQAVQAKKLAIGHFSARYRDLEPLLAEAQEVFQNTELALEGKVFDLRKDNSHV